MTVGVGSFGIGSVAFLGLFALLCIGWISRYWAIVALIMATLFWALAGFWPVHADNNHQTAYGLFFYTEALLFLRIDETIQSVHPIIVTLTMPLILASDRRLNDIIIIISLPVSRGLLVSTMALLAPDVCILAVAGIVYFIGGLCWSWGPTLQLTVLVGTAVVLLMVLSSTSLLHGGKRFIERNLFYIRLQLPARMASAGGQHG